MLNLDNLSGIHAISIFGIGQFVTFPLLDPQTNTYLSAANTGGEPGFDLDFVANTAIFTEETLEVNGDLAITQKLTVSVTAAFAAVIPIMDVQLARLVLIVTDNNQNKFILGTLETPIRAKFQKSTGSKPGDFSGANIVFTTESLNAASFYPF